MENLDSQELSFIITSLRHCMHCDQKVQIGEIQSYKCGCIEHHSDNKCPSPQVREKHSSCANSHKRELVQTHMQKLYPNETTINGFRQLIARNFVNLRNFIIEGKDSNEFTRDELWLMSFIWRICTLCGASLAHKAKWTESQCGCIQHDDGTCPSEKKRDHPHSCQTAYKKEVLVDFVKTSYPGESVLSAFVKHMRNECTEIVEIIKETQGKLNEDSQLDKEITKFRLKMELLHKKTEDLLVNSSGQLSLTEVRANHRKLSEAIEVTERVKRDLMTALATGQTEMEKVLYGVLQK